MRVSVFGASKPREGDPEYQAAYDLGQLLAAREHVVITGGYMGVMEAVSRGAVENGGHTIGVTCEQIETWRQIPVNKWVRQELKLPTLLTRIESLINECDAAITLPGGPGTLAELSVMWNLMGIKAIEPKPLILVGSGWEEALHGIFASLDGYFEDHQRKLLRFAPSVEHAVEKLENLAQ